MKIARLNIANFRGIKNATLDFSGHTLFLGMNNVGKSTICEALDLVLGPDRLSRFPPVQEFDFYNASYFTEGAETQVQIEIEATLVSLSEEVANKCAPHTQHWHQEEKRVLEAGEADLVDKPFVSECLRLRAIARYDPKEDEFEARTVFVDGPLKAEGQLTDVPRSVKRLFGFLYLRTLRTGSRALSLERGSLLDLILRQRGIQTGIWEDAIGRLRGLAPPIDEGAVNLAPILENIESRVGQYIPMEAPGRATHLFVSQLTREHLRKTISFFLKTSPGEEAIPFQEVGTGTLNALVLALLTFLAEIKKNKVIFAMEEPEIALPPHTQRRIANYLLENTTQCLVTSHSPYIVERFSPDQIQVLRKDATGTLTAIPVPGTTVLKGKIYRKHARRGLAEAMLGRGAIVGEGITEKDVIWATAEKLEAADPDACYPLDLSGVTIITADGDGSIPEFGAFFQAMQIQAFALYDAKKRTAEETLKLQNNFEVSCETKYLGMEKLLTDEIPASPIWKFLVDMRDSGEKPQLELPAAMPNEAQVKQLAYSLLEKNKGSGYAGRLIGHCDVAELPPTVVSFLMQIYVRFPKPPSVPPVDELQKQETGAPPADPAASGDHPA